MIRAIGQFHWMVPILTLYSSYDILLQREHQFAYRTFTAGGAVMSFRNEDDPRENPAHAVIADVMENRELSRREALKLAGAGALAAIYLLLRTRLGASLQAIRDDEAAAASVGIRVIRAKRILYILAAVGCGAAGALTLANTLFIQTQAVFGVQWSAYMIFMVLVGGLGTVEGPIVGAIAFFLIQNKFADYGAWYLVGLGASAIVFALFLPRGLWGTVETRFHVRLLPVGYFLRKVTSPT
jgi:hypothetical protein